MKNDLCLLILILLLAAAPAQAQEQNRLLEVPNGITKMDLTGDGDPETIIKAERQNFNAHNYFVTLFIWHGSYGPEETTENGSGYDAIGIETGHDLEHEITSNEPKECATYGYRLLLQNKKTFLITALINSTGSSLRCETNTATFKFYNLQNNKSGVFGWTEYYFKDFKQWTTEKKYDNVTSALDDNEEHLIDQIN